MLLDWMHQCCQNEYTAQSHIQIHCNPYQITDGIFHKTRTKKKIKFVWKYKILGGVPLWFSGLRTLVVSSTEDAGLILGLAHWVKDPTLPQL